MTTQRIPVLDRLITIPVPPAQAPALRANPWGGLAASAEASTGRVWAERRDGAGVTLEQSQTLNLPIESARYTIRAEVGTAIKVGDTLENENGETVEVLGISQIGRNRYLELLTRRIG